MRVCDGDVQGCPASGRHEEIVFEGGVRDCPLGKALSDLGDATEAADRLHAMLDELKAANENAGR